MHVYTYASGMTFSAFWSMVLSYPSARNHKDLKQAKCVDYAVDSGVYCTVKRIKKRGKIEYLQVLRGVDEIEQIICPKKVSMTAVHVYTYASGLGYRISTS